MAAQWYTCMNDDPSGSRGKFKNIKEIIKMGGKPNKGTPADKRLKENKNKPASKQNNKKVIPKKNK